MSNLHEVRDPERGPQIDTAGWLFSAIAVAIIAAATPMNRCDRAPQSRHYCILRQSMAAGSGGPCA